MNSDKDLLWPGVSAAVLTSILLAADIFYVTKVAWPNYQACRETELLPNCIQLLLFW